MGGCISVTSTSNNAALKIVACNDKDEAQRWTYTLDGKLIVSGKYLLCLLHFSFMNPWPNG